MTTNKEEGKIEPALSGLSFVVVPGSGCSALDWYKTALCAETKECYKNEQGAIMDAVMGYSYYSRLQLKSLYALIIWYIQYLSMKPRYLRDDFTPDAVVETMRDAGSVVTHEPKDVFYGDRVGQVVDKFGACWTLTKPCSPYPKNLVM